MDTILILLVVQHSSQPDPPNDVTIRSDTCHEVPPPMPLQQDAPRKTNFSSPLAQGRAVHPVKRPDAETRQEHCDTEADENPHTFQNLKVAVIQARLLLLRRNPRRVVLLLQAFFLGRTSERRAQSHLHGVYGSKHDESGKGSIHSLVKAWILEVVVIGGDEDTECHEEDAQQKWPRVRPRIRQRRPDHETGGVYHVELVEELPWI